jgi:hypothetical protein
MRPLCPDLRHQRIQPEHRADVVEIRQLRAHLQEVFAVRHDVVDVVVVNDANYLSLQPGFGLGVIQTYSSRAEIVFHQPWRHPLRVVESDI